MYTDVIKCKDFNQYFFEIVNILESENCTYYDLKHQYKLFQIGRAESLTSLVVRARRYTVEMLVMQTALPYSFFAKAYTVVMVASQGGFSRYLIINVLDELEILNIGMHNHCTIDNLTTFAGTSDLSVLCSRITICLLSLSQRGKQKHFFFSFINNLNLLIRGLNFPIKCFSIPTALIN